MQIGKLIRTKMKMTKRKDNVVVGRMKKYSKGFGFVIIDNDRIENDVFISKYNMGGAMDGDFVQVDLIPRHYWRKSPEGIVIKVLERAYTEVVGTFIKSKKFGFVVPEGKILNEDIFIRKKDFSGAQRGDKVVAKITRYPDDENSAEGKIIEVISRRGQVGGDIKAMIRVRGLSMTFPIRVTAAAKTVAERGIVPKDLEGRHDLRDKNIFTIDGNDSKDFDDAVSISMTQEGNYLLGVHIADVSHYVAESGPLDREALKRGCSIYFLDQVLPMLPESLSNGICSINPDVDRLTLSVDMEITPEGRVVTHDIYESIIRSKARLTYSKVSRLIDGAADKNEAYSTFYEEFGSAVSDDILLMAKLAEILRKNRYAAGSLDFDIEEAQIQLDRKGRPVDIGVAERCSGNRLIEEFMLMANQTVAEHFFRMRVPLIYRIHEKPTPDKMWKLKTFLNGLGISIKGSPINIHPVTLSNVLNRAAGHSYERVVNSVVLRSMQKAYYGTECKGHFGLSYKYYCHFTSPIRRYPDLIIHRIIKRVLKGNMNTKDIKNFRRKTEAAADASSVNEVVSVELERDVEKYKKAEYMTYHIGEEFEGVISGVTGFGIYVQIKNTVEGLVRLNDIRDDYYDFDAEHYCIKGRRTGKTYMPGDTVTIKVMAADPEMREIDFMLVSNA